MSIICELCPSLEQLKNGAKCSCGEYENHIAERVRESNQNKYFILSCESKLQHLCRVFK